MNKAINLRDVMKSHPMGGRSMIFRWLPVSTESLGDTMENPIGVDGISALFAELDRQIRTQGLEARAGKIVDATLVGARAQAAFHPGRKRDSGSGRHACRLEARQATAKGPA